MFKEVSDQTLFALAPLFVPLFFGLIFAARNAPPDPRLQVPPLRHMVG